VRTAAALIASLLLIPSGYADDEDDTADVTAKVQRAGGDEQKQYHLIKYKKDDRPPAGGYGVVVVLPGGNGSVDFVPFGKRVFKYALPTKGFLFVQLVAPKWTPNQEIVWPTAMNKADVPGLKFTTEEFVTAVLDDVATKYETDPEKVYTLSWSSGGPAAYAVALTNPKIKGSFVAMSVFKPDDLPALEKAKGKPFYLYHSEEDMTCPYEMAEEAEKKLREAEAKVKLATYEGGHGWKGDVYADLKTGFKWLMQNQPEGK
jgi:predicted esterase